jgi:hypothetical protein
MHYLSGPMIRSTNYTLLHVRGDFFMFDHAAAAASQITVNSAAAQVGTCKLSPG